MAKEGADEPDLEAARWLARAEGYKERQEAKKRSKKRELLEESDEVTTWPAPLLLLLLLLALLLLLLLLLLLHPHLPRKRTRKIASGLGLVKQRNCSPMHSRRRYPHDLHLHL